MEKTTFEEIETSFHSMPLTKYIIPTALEQEWLKSAVADYELDLSCDLEYDEENHCFSSVLDRQTVRVLALMMYVSYLQRELSRVMALNGIYTNMDLNLYPYFNFEFFKLVCGDNLLEVVGNCMLEIQCEFPVNVGG